MIKLKGYDEAGQLSLPAGGYVGRIVGARVGEFQDHTPALFVAADVVEGEFAEYFARETAKFKKSRPDVQWSSNGTLKIRLFDDDAQNIYWQLKNFLEAVKSSNGNFKADDGDDFDEKTLCGKYIGLIVGLKESDKLKSDGTPYTNAYISYAVSVGEIESGDFKIPPVKKSKNAPQPEKPKSNVEPPTDDIEDPPF